jgi:Uma2 family endonuclease
MDDEIGGITISSGRGQGAWPKQGQWTYDDYLARLDALEDGRTYELIHGMLYISNAPGARHEACVGKLRFWLTRYAHEQRRGHLLTKPFRLHLTEQARPIQPDLFFTFLTDWPGARAKYFKGVPALIVEVLAPQTYRTDQMIKFRLYEQAGVAEYWLANPHTQAVQVYVRGSEGMYQLHNEFVGQDILESRTLAGLRLVTAELFA